MQLNLNYPNSPLNSELEQPDLTPAITVSITHPFASMRYVDGFSHLWAVYVTGFNPKFHCQKTFKGRISEHIKTRNTPLNEVFVFDEKNFYDSLYICGVASGPISGRCHKNFHLALEFSLGENCVGETYNGFVVQVHNAVRLPIPELPRNWAGFSEAYTRCCNFRFCVSRFETGSD